MTFQHAQVGAIMLDCHDPEALLGFWSEIVGVEASARYPDYIFTTPIQGGSIRLAFQRVPEDKVVKNRMHLDLSHPEPEVLVEKVLELGGSRIADHGIEDFHWTVLADPEGNEFCVAPHG